MRQEIVDDLDALLAVLPPNIADKLREYGHGEELLEIVMDLGRQSEARYANDQEVFLSDREVSPENLDYVVGRIGEFGEDNRAGIERTLHRISAIRNRKGRIVGLTSRVGRAVFGTIDIITDIVESGQSILLLGRPGVGKTTMLRETARILAEKKRVVIVDTSNEIAGDGDIPHPAIGRSRRMQVSVPSLQHEVMIEAVENHMPEVIVIDEIGRELEAMAARTIAERGVQLVGTAHGNNLDNLMLNPTLADLIGGIQTVTLSDEEARRRGTQKSVLERKAPPTFDVVIEIQDRDHLVIHHDVAAAVDGFLRGRPVPAELRYRDQSGQVQSERYLPAPAAALQRQGGGRAGSFGQESGFGTERGFGPERGFGQERRRDNRRDSGHEYLPAVRETFEMPEVPAPSLPDTSRLATTKVYPYGINQNRLTQAAKALKLPVVIVNDVHEADIVITLKNYYRRRPAPINEAERGSIPVYVLRSNTLAQMESCLADVFGLEYEPDPFSLAMLETQEAINQVLAESRPIELSPQNAYIRRQQHEMARAANLLSRSRGKEPRRRVRIYPNNGV
ncbi:MAG: AAA family ATPase [Chloroflexi bacterium]|nr:AAA family ATPase [Chloroflexota bacterium]